MMHVTCAIIEMDTKVLCAQRSAQMPLPLKWEFPGGKVEEGEALEDCIVREIKEELGLDIAILEALPPSMYDYGTGKQICLYPFICHISSGVLSLKEHKQVAWLSIRDLAHLDWAAADIPVLNYYIQLKNA